MKAVAGIQGSWWETENKADGERRKKSKNKLKQMVWGEERGKLVNVKARRGNWRNKLS